VCLGVGTGGGLLCDQGDEPYGYIQYAEFLEQHRHCQLLQ
jgi:hypothetical protein